MQTTVLGTHFKFKLLLSVLFTTFLLGMGGKSWGQIAQLELGTTDYTSNTTGAVTFTSKDANLASLPATSLTAGQQGQAGGVGFISSKIWATTPTVDQTKYFQFTLTASSGYSIAVTSVSFKLYRSSTGPAAVQLSSDADGYGSALGTATLPSAAYTTFTASGITISGKSSVTFRLYGYNASGTGTLRIGDGLASSPDITVTGAVTSSTTPSINPSPTSLSGFTYNFGSGPSTPSQNFTVSASNLSPVSGNVTITAPTDYEVSLNNTTFTSSVAIAYTGGALTAAGPVYVRLKAGLPINTYNETVSLSNGTTTSSVAVSGSVTAVPNYFWNGPTTTGTGPSTGGMGTWNTTTTNWIAPTNDGSGTSVAWPNNATNIANFNGSPGVVTLGVTPLTPVQSNFNVSGYTILSGASSILQGAIVLGAGVSLQMPVDNATVANSSSVTLGLTGNITGGSGSSLILRANGTASTVASRINLSASGETVSVPVTISVNSGVSYPLAGFVGFAPGTTVSSNITNNTGVGSAGAITMLGATSGNALTYSGVVSGTSNLQFSAGGSGGAGVVTISGNNTYTGTTYFNAAVSGIIKLGVANALPTTTDLSMAYSSGNGGILDLNGFNQTVGNLLIPGSGGGKITNSGSGASTLTITQTNNAPVQNFSLPIRDSISKVALIKVGTASLILSSPVNNYSGGTTITAGTLQAGAINTLPAAGAVILNGGTLATGGFSQGSAGTPMGTLSLTDNSTIALSTGTNSLYFAASNGVSWTSGKTLTITGWQGSYNGTAGTAGRIFVGSSTSGLTAAQLSQIQFYNGTNYYTATIITGGEVVPLCTAPVIGSQPSTSNQATCLNGTPFPTLSVTASGGTGTLTYQWYSNTSASTSGGSSLGNSNGAQTSTYQPQNTAVGTLYYYVVVSGSSCSTTSSISGSFTVNALPAAPTVSLTQPTCSVATGTITVTAPTGTGITYSIDGTNYQAGTTFNNVAAGATYNVTAKSSSGCLSSVTTATVNAQPPTPAAPTVSTTQPTCSVATGTITVTAPTGTGITYSIDGTTYQPSNTFNNVTVGATYNVTVQNSAGCISPVTTATVNAQPPTPAAPTVSTTQPTCSVPTGTITVTAPTGTGITYSIDGTNYQSGTTFTNVATGTYNVTAQSSAGCISSVTTATVNSQPPTPAAPTVSLTQPTCAVATGTITVTAPTGTGLTYSIGGAYQAGTTFNNVTAGTTYNVTAQSSAGCISPITTATVITQPSTPAAPTVSITQPTCSVATGTITVTAPTGTGITYSIDGNNYQASTTFNNVVAGTTYNVTAQSSAGCISPITTATVNAQPPTPAAPTVSITQPTCSVATGTITVSAPTGTGITYSINGTTYQATTTFSGVTPGTYNVTAQSSAGCISSGTTATIVAQPGTPAAPTVSITQPTCSVATGTITVTAPTGTGITYSINGTTYQSGTTFTNVATGTYNVTVQNSTGCTSTATTATVNAQPPTPAAPTVSITQPTCSVATGTITVTAPTGTGITYSIDGTTYQAGTTFNNVAAGTYNVTAQSSAGCISPVTTATINAQPPTPAAPTVSIIQPTCTVATGTITVTAPTGTGLTYSIGGAYQAGTTFNNVTAGATYNVTVQNSAGCISPVTTATVNAQPPTPIAPSVSITQPTCSVATGTITVTAPTGTGITYSIDGTNYQSGTTFTNVATGTYNVTAQNSTGCISLATTATVNAQPPTPVISTQPSTAAQNVCQNGTASALSVTVSGTGLSYQWYSNTTNSNSGGTSINSANSSTYTPSTVTTGTLYYYVVVTNSTACSTTSDVSGAVTVNSYATITLSSAAGTDNQLVVLGNAITDVTYAITGGTGATTTGLPAGVTGSFNAGTYTLSGTPTVAGTYNYNITTTSTSGCNVIVSGTIIVCSIPSQDTGIVFTTVQPNNMTVNWTVGNGTGRIVLMNKTNNFTNPTNSTTLLPANPVYSGIGQQVVYNGSNDSVIVSSLLPGTNYWFRVYEYNNCSGTYIYDTATAPHNPNNKTTAGAPLVQSNFISILTSKYMAASSSTARLPIMFRATVTGLKPNSNYRYYTNTATNSTLGGGTVDFGGTNSGAGNPIFVNSSGTVYKYSSSASLSTVNGYDSLTTDASGKYTGWFGILETNNARFTAGNVLYPTITLGDTAGVPIFRYALNDSMMALAFSTTAGANNGSFLQSKTSATPKNLVAIFDNTTGSGKPLYIAPVEYLANTGSGFNTTGTGRISAYDSSNGAWNAIIPNSNANGVRLIEQLSVTTGSLVGCAATDADGIWITGNISTVNPTNGATAKMISGTDDPLATCAVYPGINVLQSGTTYATGSTFTYSTTNVNTNNDVTFTIQNTGTDTLKIASLVVSGTAFSLQGAAPTTILAGASATFVVRFSPTAATTYTGLITINDNVPNQGTYTINLSGTGVVPLIPVIAVQQNGTGYANNSTFTYSSTIVGTNNDATFTIQNTGNTTLTISSVVVSGTAFSLQGTAPTSVAAGSTATFVVRFTPAAAASYTGSVTINSNDPNQGMYLINLNGTGSTATITTGTISGSPFCVSATSGASVSVPFTYTPAINFTGTFTAQLSSASGSFASPVSIGTISSDGSGSQTIAATLPAGTAAGTGYRIRVISSVPAATGSNNGSNLTVTAPVAPTVSIAQSPAGTICAGSSVTFTATPTNGGITPAYQWQLNGSDIPGETGSTYTTSTLVSGNQIDVVLTSSASCVTMSTATSNIITVTVTAPSSVTLSSAAGTDNQSVTQGNAITPITYAIGGGGTGATVTGLPAGVTGNYSSGVFTISGTPGVAGTFTYTVTATGGCNNNPTATGTITVCGAPSTQAGTLTFTNIQPNSITANWVNGNGSGRVVYINTTNSFTSPTNGTTLPTANTVYGGSGQQAIYIGTGNSVTVTGLTPSTQYYFRVYEYNNCTGTYIYNTSGATGNPLPSTTTGASLTQINFKSLLTPKYMVADSSFTTTNAYLNERLAVMYRATVTGLIPNTRYRYYTQAATNSSANGAALDFGTAQSGAGNPLLVNSSGTSYVYTSSPDVKTVGAYDSLTTDGSGNYTGWFGFVNTTNKRFRTTNLIYPTITVATSTGTILYRWALDSAITPLSFKTTVADTTGSFLQSKTFGTPKNMVALFDNVSGSGRPLFIAPIEFVAATGAKLANTLISGYDSTNGAWNAIIPNNNANGVRLIEQLSVTTGNVVGCVATSATGVWPTGNISTVNPTNGSTVKIISGNDDPFAPPTITVQPSSAAQSVCQNSAATALSVTATGGSLSYQWYSNTAASNTGGTLITGATSASYIPSTATAGTTYYYVVVSNTASCATTSNVSGAVMVNVTPTAAFTAPSYISCEGTAALVVINGTPNATVTYTIGGATQPTVMLNSSGSITLNSNTNPGTYNYSITNVALNTCSSTTPSNTMVTINPKPSVAPITGPLNVGIGNSIALQDATTGGVWTIDASGAAEITSSSSSPATATIKGDAIGTSVVTYTVTNSSTGCTNAATATINVYNATIASYRTSADGNYSDVSIWEIFNGNTWEAATNIPGNNNNIAVRHNLILDSNYNGLATATLAITSHLSGSTTVNGTLTIAPNHYLSSAGAVNFNSNVVTVQSNTTGAGAIGILNTAISGATNVTVERYTQKKRAWRLITSPITSATINAGWQEGNIWNGATALPSTGYGTLITGYGQGTAANANSHGYDFWSAVASTTSSIRYYVPSSGGSWGNSLPTISNVKIRDYPAYMLFVRGDRSVSAINDTSATNLRATGTLQQGTATIGNVQGGNLREVAGNPYASAIDFFAVRNLNATRIQDKFAVWASGLGTYGAYTFVSGDGNGNYTATPLSIDGSTGTAVASTASRYIQSGEGFLVYPVSNASGNITVDETVKAPAQQATALTTTFKLSPDTDRKLYVNLNQKTSDTSANLADGFLVRFDPTYTSDIDDDDATKPANFNENLGILSHNTDLIVEARADVQKTDTLHMKLWNITKRDYQLQLKGDNWTSAPGVQAYLVDNYLASKQAVSLTGSVSTVNFTVNTDSASWQSDRFSIVFQNSAAVLPVTLTSVKAAAQNGGVNVSWTVTSEQNIKTYTVERSINDGTSYTAIGSQQAKNQTAAAITNYQGFDAAPQMGSNLYRIRIETKEGVVTYSSVVTVVIGQDNGKILITLYPNPVRPNGRVSLQLTNLQTGTYLVNVYSQAGQTIYQKKITISQANTTQSETLHLGSTLAQGSYEVRLSSHTGTILFTDQLVIGR